MRLPCNSESPAVLAVDGPKPVKFGKRRAGERMSGFALPTSTLRRVRRATPSMVDTAHLCECLLLQSLPCSRPRRFCRPRTIPTMVLPEPSVVLAQARFLFPPFFAGKTLSVVATSMNYSPLAAPVQNPSREAASLYLWSSQPVAGRGIRLNRCKVRTNGLPGPGPGPASLLGSGRNGNISTGRSAAAADELGGAAVPLDVEHTRYKPGLSPHCRSWSPLPKWMDHARPGRCQPATPGSPSAGCEAASPARPTPGPPVEAALWPAKSTSDAGGRRPRAISSRTFPAVGVWLGGSLLYLRSAHRGGARPWWS